MADVNVNYDMISKVATELNAAKGTMLLEFTKLQGQVDALLQADGGFWMDLTAPAIQDQYDQFTQSLNLMAQNIGSFSDMFNSFVQNMESMDNKMSFDISHPQNPNTLQQTTNTIPPPVQHGVTSSRLANGA